MQLFDSVEKNIDNYKMYCYKIDFFKIETDFATLALRERYTNRNKIRKIALCRYWPAKRAWGWGQHEVTFDYFRQLELRNGLRKRFLRHQLSVDYWQLLSQMFDAIILSTRLHFYTMLTLQCRFIYLYAYMLWQLLIDVKSHMRKQYWEL